MSFEDAVKEIHAADPDLISRICSKYAKVRKITFERLRKDWKDDGEWTMAFKVVSWDYHKASWLWKHEMEAK